ncbi:MAG: hypothetical protein DRN35_06420 [Thermoplasmata archaeon]|nr:MAG: hypothetical protein DRN28_06135 [Thermoplasmata archaeon]RLF68841.1 MAG: hypothetical protein DRN35_06420 [Thermoplasmata archaeon]RLF73814.1 MAG: hypothetical protein DRN55_02215 [Thermoplasmata archaeon]RLF74610.1 MAG: hypothetical protein DRN42_04335 [Thermoplasmata archaeon]HDD60664.1 hypothetical protein [Euryarchaeota archaeon]
MPMDRRVYLVEDRDNLLARIVERWWERKKRKHPEGKAGRWDPPTAHVQYYVNPEKVLKDRVNVYIDAKRGSFRGIEGSYNTRLSVEVVTGEMSSILHTRISEPIYRNFERRFEREGLMWERAPGLLKRLLKGR